jgi:hypothetical protein
MRTWSPTLLRLAAACALVTAVSAVPVARVAACSCMPMAPEEAARASDVAFTGTTVHEEPLALGRGGAVVVGEARAIGAGAVAVEREAVLVDPAIAPAWATMYTFEVDGVAKGEIGPEVQVQAGGDGAGCGMSFGMNERWLIFATVEGDTLTTHLCAGNAPLAPGEEPPIPVSAPEQGAGDAGGGLPLGIVLPVLVVLALAAVSGYIFWRADRPA